jgi:hypothetical protein
VHRSEITQDCALTYDPGAGAALTVVENTRFSPSGDRIAYVHDIDGKARLSSIGFDGSAKRELAPFYGTGAHGGGLVGLDTQRSAHAMLTEARATHP